MSNPSNPSIFPRFEGESGRSRLSETLRRQIINGDSSLADAIAQKVSHIEIMPPYTSICSLHRKGRLSGFFYNRNILFSN